MLLNRSRAEREMSRQGLDILVATSPENVMYSTDYECSTHWLMPAAQIYTIITPGRSPYGSLIAPLLELEAIVDGEVWVDDIYLIGFFSRGSAVEEEMDAVGRRGKKLSETARKMDTAVEALVDAIEKRGLSRGRIGLDESGVSPQIWAEILQRLPKATILPAANVWWEIRMVKTEEELRRLRLAAQFTEQAFNVSLSSARPGVKESEIVRVYHEQLAIRGARPTFSMFCSGPRTSQPHPLESERALEKGDPFRYDLGSTYRYYHADIARSYVLGKPKDLYRRIWDALVEGVEKALNMIRPGADPGEIFEAAMKPGQDLGLKGFNRVHCGHGVGISVYDPPLVTRMDPTRSIFLMPAPEGGLSTNMVLNVEVGYHIQGVAGFLCEETTIVTEKGYELLTHNSKQLSFHGSLD
jgi:Xaa-Pro dipeptidase